MCHFCIYSEVSGTNGQGISQKLCANYLFQDVDHPKVIVTYLDPLNQATSETWITNLGATSYVIELNEDNFKAGTVGSENF